MSATRKLWLGLAALLIASFAVLLWAGGEIFRATRFRKATCGTPRRTRVPPRDLLGFEPRVHWREGLRLEVEWLREVLGS